MSAPPSPVDERKTDDVSKPTASGKDASSLKRVREGSTEPASADVAPPVVPVVTKKNRTVPPTDGEPLSRKTSAEGQTVGEVRKKVEEMTWKEGEAKKRANGHAATGDKVTDTTPETALIEADEETAAEIEESVPLEAGWEKTESTDAEGAAVEVSHKRKQMDRNDSSLGSGEDVLKRTKEEETKEESETPSEQVVDSKDEDKPADAVDEQSAIAAPAPVKKPQTTFSSFSSAASPFSAGLKHTSAFGSAAAQPVASSSSSPKPSAFGGYSSAFSAFAAKDKKEAKAEDKAEGSKSSFGDILKDTQEDKGNDKGDKLQMTTQDVPTGEEDEETVYQLRVKLHVMEKDGGWKERGTGPLRLNVRKSDGKGARLVMRAEGVLRLVLNVPLFVGMSCTEEGKHVRMTVIEDGQIRNLAFRTNSAKVASELYNQIHDLIPLESAGSKSPQPFGESAAGGWDV